VSAQNRATHHALKTVFSPTLGRHREMSKCVDKTGQGCLHLINSFVRFGQFEPRACFPSVSRDRLLIVAHEDAALDLALGASVSLGGGFGHDDS